MLTAKGVEIGEPTFERLNELLTKHPNEIAILVHKYEKQYKFSPTDPRFSDRTDIRLGVIGETFIKPGNTKESYQFPFSNRYILLEKAESYTEELEVIDENLFLYQFEFLAFLADMAFKMEIWKPSEEERQHSKYDFVVGEEEIKKWFKNHVELWMSDLDIRLFKATNIFNQPIKVDSPRFEEKLQRRRGQLIDEFNRLVREKGKYTDQLESLKVEMATFGVHW